MTFPGHETLIETLSVPYGPESFSALKHDFQLRHSINTSSPTEGVLQQENHSAALLAIPTITLLLPLFVSLLMWDQKKQTTQKRKKFVLIETHHLPFLQSHVTHFKITFFFLNEYITLDVHNSAGASPEQRANRISKCLNRSGKKRKKTLLFPDEIKTFTCECEGKQWLFRCTVDMNTSTGAASLCFKEFWSFSYHAHQDKKLSPKHKRDTSLWDTHQC